MPDEPRPKVGVGVAIYKDGKILLDVRRNAHGDGEYAFPGGHLEFGESIAECAKRETLEETGLIITNIRFLFFANLVNYSGKHYAHIHMAADWKTGEPENREPEKCEGWEWHDPTNLPRPLFKTGELLEEHLKTRQTFFDSQ